MAHDPQHRAFGGCQTRAVSDVALRGAGAKDFEGGVLKNWSRCAEVCHERSAAGVRTQASSSASTERAMCRPSARIFTRMV